MSVIAQCACLTPSASADKISTLYHKFINRGPDNFLSSFINLPFNTAPYVKSHSLLKFSAT